MSSLSRKKPQDLRTQDLFAAWVEAIGQGKLLRATVIHVEAHRRVLLHMPEAAEALADIQAHPDSAGIELDVEEEES
jgi:hypothetical protein